MSSEGLHFGDLHQEAEMFCFAPWISHDRTTKPGSRRQDPARSGDRVLGASPAEAPDQRYAAPKSYEDIRRLARSRL